MTPQAIATKKQDDIRIATLDRPDVRNAVDSPTARALHAAFLAVENDPRAPRPMGPSRLQPTKPVLVALSGAAQALLQEWQRDKARIPDALGGTTRFAAGQEHHGQF